MIEAAKSGRASCRTCKEPIPKGDLRLGEEVPNQFSEGGVSYNWHHLQCAAKKKPAALKQALDATDIDIPDKSELLQTIESSAKTEKPGTFPYAEKAPTSRSSCVGCGEKIDKDELRVAVPAEVTTGSFSRPGAKYLHPGCAVEHTEQDPEELFEAIKANSLNLSPAELDVLDEGLQGQAV